MSSPWSLGFVLAVILGAMLVPGCRPVDVSAGPQSVVFEISLTDPGEGKLDY